VRIKAMLHAHSGDRRVEIIDYSPGWVLNARQASNPRSA
jgi:hypothetical protein